ncbi:MAG: hypothetical protein EOP83_20290 [Verrucomicrobiaceae bacterium]|nr:MAG: hypothetical protein EOP83_20290 [Verrucomicrobiaceae bacterium]
MSETQSCWYYRGGERIEAIRVHEFTHQGETYVVMQPPNGEMEVRLACLVGDEPAAPIGFGSVTDELDAEIADIVMPNARAWPGGVL